MTDEEAQRLAGVGTDIPTETQKAYLAQINTIRRLMITLNPQLVGKETPLAAGPAFTSGSAPAGEQADKPPKLDTSYGAYREWCRQQGKPLSDGAPTEREFAAYHSWRETQRAKAGTEAGR